MGTDKQLEIYKQRYETFRFFYRLEWQLLQVRVVIGLGLFALGVENDNGNPSNWRYFASGGVFLGFSYAMHRMANYPSWIEYTRLVGDFNVQPRASGGAAPPSGGGYCSTLWESCLSFAPFVEPTLSELDAKSYHCHSDSFTSSMDRMANASQGNLLPTRDTGYSMRDTFSGRNPLLDRRDSVSSAMMLFGKQVNYTL